jgi:hypothetical protein
MWILFFYFRKGILDTCYRIIMLILWNFFLVDMFELHN